MFDTPDHYVIQNMERTGYPDGKEPEYPHCPVCGSDCETVYKNQDGEIFACEECVECLDAWNVDECSPDKEDR